MSAREFWNEEPELLWAYRKMYMEKIKTDREVNNYIAWLNGLYIFDAISACLYNGFGRREGQPAKNYIEQPIDFNAKPKTREEIERERRLEVEAQIRERNRQIKNMLNKKE